MSEHRVDIMEMQAETVAQTGVRQWICHPRAIGSC